MITAGLDGGSRAFKAALFDTAGGRILATARADQGVMHKELAHVMRCRWLPGASVQHRLGIWLTRVMR